MNIGRSIRVAIAKNDLNQTRLAERMGVSRAYISKLCCSQHVSMAAARRIADEFGMKLSDFIALGENDGQQ